MIIDHAHNIQASMNANASASNNQTGYVSWADYPVGAEQGMAVFPTYGGQTISMTGTVIATIVPPAPAGFVRGGGGWGGGCEPIPPKKTQKGRDSGGGKTGEKKNAKKNSVFYKASMLTL